VLSRFEVEAPLVLGHDTAAGRGGSAGPSLGQRAAPSLYQLRAFESDSTKLDMLEYVSGAGGSVRGRGDVKGFHSRGHLLYQTFDESRHLSHSTISIGFWKGKGTHMCAFSAVIRMLPPPDCSPACSTFLIASINIACTL
jgi:hypothetical protein